jgi:hypothetical protein
MEGSSHNLLIEYKPSYHGDPEREHRFWRYRKEDNPPNFMKWDFKQKGKHVCSNVEKLNDGEFRCKGHDRGCHLLPSYHGDPNRHYRFWVYKQN